MCRRQGSTPVAATPSRRCRVPQCSHWTAAHRIRDESAGSQLPQRHVRLERLAHEQHPGERAEDQSGGVHHAPAAAAGKSLLLEVGRAREERPCRREDRAHAADQSRGHEEQADPGAQQQATREIVLPAVRKKIRHRSAGGFLAVHRLVGGGEQRCRIARVIRIQAHAEAGTTGHIEGLSQSKGVVNAARMRSPMMPGVSGRTSVSSRTTNSSPAEPCHGVDVSNTRANATGRLAQHLVARRVAECVVHFLKAVEVDEEKGQPVSACGSRA